MECTRKGDYNFLDNQKCSNSIFLETERRILKVRTGESDYMANCGALGEFIIREKLHGEGRPKAMSLWEVKRRLALLDQGVIQED